MTIVYCGFEYIISVIEIMLCFFFNGIFLSEEGRNRKDTVLKVFCYSIVISVIIFFLNQIQLYSFINAVLAIIIMSIVQMMFYRKKYGVIIFLTLIYAVVVSAIDFVAAQVESVVFNVTIESLLNGYSLQRLECILISKILLLITLYIICRYNKNRGYLYRKYIWNACFFAIALFLLNYYIFENNIMNNSVDMRIFSAVFFVTSVVLVILIFSLVIKIAENFKQRQDVALLELQNDMLIKSEKNIEQAFKLWRSSIHDYKHKIFAMKKWIDQENIDALKDYIEKENACLNQKTYYIKTGNDVIDAIVNTKKFMAEEKGITFMINVVMPDKYNISDIDLVCVLGNLLDNAMEASETQSKKYITLVIKEVKQMIYIKVINFYEGELSEELATTKEDKVFHGIGVKNVKEIVKRYGGTYEIVKDKDEVITTVMLVNK